MAQVTIECKVKKTVWLYIILILLKLRINPSSYLFGNRPIMRMYINGKLNHTYRLNNIPDDQSGEDKEG